jgi:hypothetical protein
MGAVGNKKPKKDKSAKHGKHVPSYQLDQEATKPEFDDFKKKK